MTGRRQGFVPVVVRRLQGQEMFAEILVQRVGKELFSDGLASSDKSCDGSGLSLQC